MTRTVSTWVVSALLRAAAFALIWAGLAGWSADYAVYGVVSVALVTAMSLVLLAPAPGRPAPGTWPRRCWFGAALVGWFLWQAVRGGVDVALRAVRRTPDIDPLVLTVPVDLPDGAARQVAQLLMNLMPGTLIQGESRGEAGGRHVELHTIAAELEPAEQWAQLQRRVGRVFGAAPESDS